MQNCDFQIDSFRAHLLEFLELQVSGVCDHPRHPGVCRASRSLREEGPGRGGSESVSGPSALHSSPGIPRPPSSLHFSWWSLLARLCSRSASPKERPSRFSSPLSFPALKKAPGGSDALSAKVSDGNTWPSLLFEDGEDGRKQGWPARGGWWALERDGFAAPGRSAGAQYGPRGRVGATGPGQWGAPRSREPVGSRPPAVSRSPRPSAAHRLPEGARGARQRRRRTYGTSPFLLPERRTSGILPESPCRAPLPWFLNWWPPTPCGPNSWLDFKDAFCKGLRPCPGDAAETFALMEPGQEWDL